MRVAVAVLAVLFLIAPASSGFAWPRTVGRSHNCTVWAVRADLLVTASHCVGAAGETIEVAMPVGAGWRWHDAVVVWDGITRGGEWEPDVALLRPSLPWPEHLLVARTIPDNTACVTLSHPLGLERLRGQCVVYGLRQEDKVWWLAWYGNLVGPGSSGGPIIVAGYVVGIVVSGNPEFRIYRGTPAGDIARAIREYDAQQQQRR